MRDLSNLELTQVYGAGGNGNGCTPCCNTSGSKSHGSKKAGSHKAGSHKAGSKKAGSRKSGSRGGNGCW